MAKQDKLFFSIPAGTIDKVLPFISLNGLFGEINFAHVDNLLPTCTVGESFVFFDAFFESIDPQFIGPLKRGQEPSGTLVLSGEATRCGQTSADLNFFSAECRHHG